MVCDTRSIPSRSISMLVAELSDSTIIGNRQVVQRQLRAAVGEILQQAAAAHLVAAADGQPVGELHLPVVGTPVQLDQDRDLDRAALREDQSLVDAEPLARTDVDDRDPDDTGSGGREALELVLQLGRQLVAVLSLRRRGTCQGGQQRNECEHASAYCHQGEHAPT